ncbi:hypothetical protein [Nocardia farcinica]|uniref:hypothetical protein n=1 Tax=Nocardia farcinica TaxID=37329 RepID=UPI00245602F1|nr:hypothetical protein [Nocardia farcinica]
MSDTDPVRQPKNNAEWARRTERRIEQRENPTAQRIGPWVLSASSEGHLIGSHVDGGSAIILRKPASGENDPDAITDSALPSVTATRSAAQSISSSGALVMFDGVAHEIGEWTGGLTTFDTMRVPETGVYDVSATAWFSAGGAYLHAVVLVDGVTRVGGRLYDAQGATTLPVLAMGQLALNAGQAVGLFVVAAGKSRNVGAASVFTTPIPTSLSLSMTSRSE